MRQTKERFSGSQIVAYAGDQVRSAMRDCVVSREEGKPLLPRRKMTTADCQRSLVTLCQSWRKGRRKTELLYKHHAGEERGVTAFPWKAPEPGKIPGSGTSDSFCSQIKATLNQRYFAAVTLLNKTNRPLLKSLPVILQFSYRMLRSPNAVLCGTKGGGREAY